MAILETFIVFGVGIFAWRKKMIMPEDLDKLSRLTLDVFFPLLTFSTIVRTFDPAKLNELWLMPVMGFAIMLVGGVFGIFFKRLVRNRTPERLRTFHHICAINNYVFLPIIVLANIWGERHVALILVMNVGSTIGFWTIGILTLTGHSDWKDMLKSLFSVNIGAVALALAVCFLGIPVPSAIGNAAKNLGDMSVPFMLLLIGVALAQNFRHVFTNAFDILWLSAVRLVLLPLIIVLLLKLLPLPAEVFQVAFVVALMPAASSSVLVARRYGGSSEMAGQAIIVTTLLSLVTIPVMMNLFFG
jgi:hypothetical protein